MKFSFKHSLLATSCLSIFLSMSYPAFSMEDKDTDNNSIAFIKEKPLEESAFKDHDFKSLFTLYLKTKNEKALDLGLEFQQDWAISVKLKQLETKNAQKELEEFHLLLAIRGNEKSKKFLKEHIQQLNNSSKEELKKFHILLANRGYGEEKSEEFLDKLNLFNAQEWFKKNLPFIKSAQNINVLINKIKDIGYYKPFRTLISLKTSPCKQFTIFTNAIPKFWQEAAKLGHPEAMEVCMRTYAWEDEKLRDRPLAKKWALKLTKFGDKEAMFTLGVAYAEGWDGSQPDHDKAFSWLTKAAEKGHERAKCRLIGYWSGDLKKDEKKAFFHLNQLLQKNSLGEKENATLLFEMGKRYKYGHSVEKDPVKAFEYFKKSAPFLEESALEMAWAYKFGDGVPKDLNAAIKYLTPLTKTNPIAMNELGLIYELRQNNGDVKLAFDLYTTAKKQNHYGAINNLGVLYYYGKGVKKSLSEAVNNFQRAADGGDINSMLALGHIYIFDEYKDIPKIREYLKNAIAKGNQKALSLLAHIYCVEDKNYKESFKLFERAAKLGERDALLSCGMFLWKGWGVTQDNTSALPYFLKAVEKGSSEAMLKLAMYYFECAAQAESQEKSEHRATAFFWLKKASSLKNAQAKILLKGIKSKDEEIAKEFAEILGILEKKETIIPQKLDIESSGKEISLPIEMKESSESSSSDDEIESTSSMEESQQISEPLSMSQHKVIYNNYKYMRDLGKKSREAYNLKKKEEKQVSEPIKLSPKNEEIIHMLKSEEKDKIKENDLNTLFSDPFFEHKGKVEIINTKNGFAIVGINYTTNKFFTTSTHWKHNKSYDGFNKTFLKNVLKVVEIFQ